MTQPSKSGPNLNHLWIEALKKRDVAPEIILGALGEVSEAMSAAVLDLLRQLREDSPGGGEVA